MVKPESFKELYGMNQIYDGLLRKYKVEKEEIDPQEMQKAKILILYKFLPQTANCKTVIM